VPAVAAVSPCCILKGYAKSNMQSADLSKVYRKTQECRVFLTVKVSEEYPSKLH